MDANAHRRGFRECWPRLLGRLPRTQRTGCGATDRKISKIAFGQWHTHTRRYTNALSAHPTAIELDGTVTVRKIWNGMAALEEVEADGPDGHWQGMTLFLHDPDTAQRRQTVANSRQGILQPPTIGGFKEGQIELFGQDEIGGRAILVRSLWPGIRPEFHRYTESRSDDGGKLWRPAFAAELTMTE